LNYSDEQLNNAGKALTRLYMALHGFDLTDAIPLADDYLARFEQAMDDDFNTPMVLSVLFDLAREINKAQDIAIFALSGQTQKSDYEPQQVNSLAATLRYIGGLLGILQNDTNVFLQGEIEEEDIEQQIFERMKAKEAKNWALADKIRDDLKAQGVILEDMPDGTFRWRCE
jgi:cysteinyl-tRNA synthetase